ncbi:hypothetical protein AcW2_004665 [Taiwanofungus camphoratus]|nr:hypothetical protein AcW2_004665 [Antrodia cinnamomea]
MLGRQDTEPVLTGPRLDVPAKDAPCHTFASLSITLTTTGQQRLDTALATTCISLDNRDILSGADSFEFDATRGADGQRYEGSALHDSSSFVCWIHPDH